MGSIDFTLVDYSNRIPRLSSCRVDNSRARDSPFPPLQGAAISPLQTSQPLSEDRISSLFLSPSRINVHPYSSSPSQSSSDPDKINQRVFRQSKKRLLSHIRMLKQEEKELPFLHKKSLVNKLETVVNSVASLDDLFTVSKLLSPERIEREESFSSMASTKAPTDRSTSESSSPPHTSLEAPLKAHDEIGRYLRSQVARLPATLQVEYLDLKCNQCQVEYLERHLGVDGLVFDMDNIEHNGSYYCPTYSKRVNSRKEEEREVQEKELGGEREEKDEAEERESVNTPDASPYDIQVALMSLAALSGVPLPEVIFSEVPQSGYQGIIWCARTRAWNVSYMEKEGVKKKNKYFSLYKYGTMEKALQDALTFRSKYDNVMGKVSHSRSAAPTFAATTPQSLFIS